MGKVWGQLERLAQNRDAWRELVQAAYAPDGTSGGDEMRDE
jgi:hypothetical protein